MGGGSGAGALEEDVWLVSSMVVFRGISGHDARFSLFWRTVQVGIDPDRVGFRSKYPGCLMRMCDPVHLFSSMWMISLIDSTPAFWRLDFVSSGRWSNQIKIMPPEASGVRSLKAADSVRPKTFFVLQTLKSTLPGVIVQGIPSVNRAVINVQDLDRSKTGGEER